MNYLLVVQVFVRTPSRGLVGHFCVEINTFFPVATEMKSGAGLPGCATMKKECVQQLGSVVNGEAFTCASGADRTNPCADVATGRAARKA